MIHILKIFFFLTISCFLVSCASYHSSFSCPDAKGGKCLSIDIIDHLIDSGEIERLVGINDKSCKGKRCDRKNKSFHGKRSESLPTLRNKDEQSIFFPQNSNDRAS